MSAAKRQTAEVRLNLRITQEELSLLEEVRQLMDVRSQKLRVPDGVAIIETATQRRAIVESLRYYVARLRELERSR